MKKTLLFAFALLFATATMAQNRVVLLQESFDGSTLPTGWSISSNNSNWSVSATANAGGSANEMKLDWSPQFNGTTRLVSPAIDLTGISGVVFSFKHALDNYSGTNTIGVATSSDGGATWNQAWSQGYGTNGAWAVSEEIATSDMGQANVQFCIFFTGNSYNINDWYFDDIVVFTLENLDLGIEAATLNDFIGSVQEVHLHTLLQQLFIEDQALAEKFRSSSAAKSIHHGFIGGLLEHTLSVTKLCDYYCKHYPRLNRDLLLTAAICHDIGKVRELSSFPMNDYTNEGQFIGHIVIGAQLLEERIAAIDGFPEDLRLKLIHCILSHHGEYEFGSPKKPALIEALALNMADNTDAKLEAFREVLDANAQVQGGWLGFNRLFDSNIYKPAE